MDKKLSSHFVIEKIEKKLSISKVTIVIILNKRT